MPHTPGRRTSGVERFQRRFGAHREAFEPAADTAVGGQVFQTAKPLQQRISLQEAQMSQSTATHQQQTEEHPTQTYHAEITARNDGRQVPTQLTVPSDAAPIPDQQLQTGIRSEAFGGEFDGQIVVDARPQIRFLSSHSTWPFVFGEKGVSPLPNNRNERPFCYGRFSNSPPNGAH